MVVEVLMDEINAWLTNPILFAVAVLFFYMGKRLFDYAFDYVVRKTKTDYVSKEQFDEIIKKTKEELNRECKDNRDRCSIHRHESLAWLEPTMKKVIKQNVEVKKLIHLIGTKMGLEEEVLRSLINGDADLFEYDK